MKYIESNYTLVLIYRKNQFNFTTITNFEPPVLFGYLVNLQKRGTLKKSYFLNPNLPFATLSFPFIAWVFLGQILRFPFGHVLFAELFFLIPFLIHSMEKAVCHSALNLSYLTFFLGDI